MVINMATDNDYEERKYNGWKHAEKEITFDGGTTNAIGDHDGTGDPFDIFTVTGTVRMKIYAICTTTLVGASSTLEVGVTGGTAKLIAQTTGTDIDVNEIWHDATPDSAVELDSVAVENIVANSLNVIGTVGTANITAGVIKFICLWKPVTINGNVKPA